MRSRKISIVGRAGIPHSWKYLRSIVFGKLPEFVICRTWAFPVQYFLDMLEVVPPGMRKSSITTLISIDKIGPKTHFIKQDQGLSQNFVTISMV